MKINPIYRGLLDKSMASMLSAIEIYNKPDFKYREETFAILAINAWELLFKAYILKQNKYNTRSIYELEPALLKNNKRSESKKVIARNRSGNPKTISIYTAIKKIEAILPKNLKVNIEALIEPRDNAVHFYNMTSLVRPIQELGFACIKNYIAILKVWDLPIDISQYNLYLMPLAYVDGKKLVESTLTDEQNKYIKLLQEKLRQKDQDDDFDIAVSIKLDFHRENSIEAIGMRYDPNGIAISLSEEDIRKRFPHTYEDIVRKCRERYVDFKRNNLFHTYMKEVKLNDKLVHTRKLYPDNPKSSVAILYNGAVFKFLDEKYTRK